MSYATTDDVLARAGRVSGAFQVAGRHPDVTDLGKFLADTSAEIDAELRALGYDPASLDASVTAAFKDLNAYGALARALPGIPDPPQTMLDDARSLWDAGLAAILDGSFPAIAELQAGAGGGGAAVTAGSLSTDDPSYGMYVSAIERLGLNPTYAPMIERTTRF